MKGYKQLISVMIAPYFIIFTFFFLIIGGRFLGDASYTIAMVFLVLMMVIYLIGGISTLVLFVSNNKKKKNALELLRINMIIKIVHIFAYILIFLLALLFSITIFTFAFSLLLMLIDFITIIQSGTIGLTGIISAKHEGKLSKSRALLYGISQFIFCLDVVAAVVLYFKLKAIYFEEMTI